MTSLADGWRSATCLLVVSGLEGDPARPIRPPIGHASRREERGSSNPSRAEVGCRHVLQTYALGAPFGHLRSSFGSRRSQVQVLGGRSPQRRSGGSSGGCGKRCTGHQLHPRDLTVDVLPRGDRPGEPARQPFRGRARLLAIESGQKQATGAWVSSAGAYTGARLSPAVEPGEGRWQRRVPARGRRRAECRRNDGRITR